MLLKRGILLIPLVIAAVCPALAGDAPRSQIKQIVAEGMPESTALPAGIIPPAPMPRDTAAIRRTALALSRFLSENGYPYNKITVSVTGNGSDSSAVAGNDSVFILRILIESGERVCHGQPLVLGAVGRADMYLRDVRLVPGRLYSAADVDETLRRFGMRPYIREASAASPVIIEDAPPCRDSLRPAVTPFTVAERRGMELEGVLGYESGRGGESGTLGGRLDLSFLNMLRRGERADVSYSGAAALQKLSFTASRPWVFGLPLEAGGALGLEIEDGGYGYFWGEFRLAAEINARWKCGIALKGSETIPPDTIENPYRFYGADVFLALLNAPWERGRTVPELSLVTGSGVANRDKSYARSKMELSAGIHRPISERYAVAARACAKSLFTDESYLPPAERYRTGGHGSLRGYSAEEFAFRAAACSQLEALYYFNRTGSIYIFTDSGTGWDEFGDRLILSNAVKMLGYGAGLRFPSRLGTISVEYARNINDGTSLGRVHVGLKTQM